MKITKISIAFIVMTAFVLTSSAQTVSSVQNVIDKVCKERVPDKRQSIFEVKAENAGNGYIKMTGKISDPENLDVLVNEINKISGSNKIRNQITLLPQDQWALVKIPVACMRSKPGYSAELATQAIMGMPMRIYENDNGWYKVQSPDGYLGWVWGSSLQKMTPEEMEQWKKSPRLVVTSLGEIKGFSSPTGKMSRDVVTDLLPGNIVGGTLDNIVADRVEVLLPDNRKVWIDVNDLTPIEEWADQDFNPDVILGQAYYMMGAPYLWGGTSAKMTDCSGLVKVSYLANGRILRRDASQQILTGTHIAPENLDDLESGDLIFFGDKPGGRATHVGLYDKDKYFIHCAGRVHQSRMVPGDPTFGRRIYLGASRINGNDGTPGIQKAKDHPWYF